MLNDSGATVEMTRQEDQEMSLEERMKIAEASGASLFLSIHFENSPNASNTVIAQYNPALGEKAASSICDGFTGELGLETKIKPIDESLKFSRIEIPAIIIDMPFMVDESNKGKLSTEEYTLKTAQTLYEGIIKSLNEKESSQ
jgi:N-acetylmuramoyl-L-alanine amidase